MSNTVSVTSDVADLMRDAAEFIAESFAPLWDRAYSASAPDNETLESERESARQVIRACAEAIGSGEAGDVSGLDLDGPGQRAAAAGLSATRLLDWFHTVEKAINEFVLGRDDVALEAIRETHSAVTRFFTTYTALEMQTYELAHDELGNWYSTVASDMIAYLTSGAAVEDSLVNRQAKSLGLDPRVPYRAIAIRSESGLSVHRWALIRHRLIEVIRRLNSQPNPIVQERKGLLIALISPAVDNAELVRALEALLADPELKRTLYLSTGEPVSRLPDAGRSCRQALSALEIGTYREYQGAVTQCTDVILEVLLTHNHWVSHRLIDSRLGDLVDKPHIIDTLRAYIACDMSLQRTAEELFVHANTVAYRLRQIATLTGRDMRRVADLVDLSVALSALDVIKMREDSNDDHTNLHAAILSGE
jgi:sugar diacid utilization regulator